MHKQNKQNNQIKKYQLNQSTQLFLDLDEVDALVDTDNTDNENDNDNQMMMS